MILLFQQCTCIRCKVYFVGITVSMSCSHVSCRYKKHLLIQFIVHIVLGKEVWSLHIIKTKSIDLLRSEKKIFTSLSAKCFVLSKPIKSSCNSFYSIFDDNSSFQRHPIFNAQYFYKLTSPVILSHFQPLKIPNSHFSTTL